MRVIAGKFRSRTLMSLEGLETRPTYDRLKETLLNVLSSAGMVAECTWADLFAGTGAVGIEALSRGAASVHFAESSGNAARVLRQIARDLRRLNLDEEGLYATLETLCHNFAERTLLAVRCDTGGE